MARSDLELKQAVDAAKEIFWRRGYKDTAIEDVVEATGLNRYALYSAFGGKRELFLAALEAYCTERKEIFLATFNDPARAPMDAIRDVCNFCATEMAKRGAGCLMCNVALESGYDDPVISAHVRDYLEEIRFGKEQALIRAAERGELNPAITPEKGAALLIAAMLGMGAHARIGADRDVMMGVMESCLDLLSSGAEMSRRSVS